MVQYSWPGPPRPGQGGRSITLIRCASCQGSLYHTKLKGEPRPEDHEPGCEAFTGAIRVARYADELRRAASEPGQGSWRSNRRRQKYLSENAKKLSLAACEPDPVTVVRDLSDQYQAESQADDSPADTARMAEMLAKACRRLALGEAPAP
jgi:hypothetical protein